MVDETRMQVQTGTSPPIRIISSKFRKKPKKSKTHRGYLWSYFAVKEKLLFFDYSLTRRTDNPAKHLKDSKGVIQSDCYEIYDQIRKADTNTLENQIRPIAVGRKNYLFCGSHEGAQRAAIFYSLFACCKMNKVNPNEWLLDVMQRLPNHPISQIEKLLPHNWKRQKTILSLSILFFPISFRR